MPLSWTLTPTVEELELELEKIARSIRRDFLATVATWDSRPSFLLSRTKTLGRTTSISVYTTDPRYLWVNTGTQGHWVQARGAKGLHFWTVYVPKTIVRWIGSRSSSRGGYERIAPQVWHPGIAPRGFTEVLAARYQKGVTTRGAQAIRRGLKRGWF